MFIHEIKLSHDDYVEFYVTVDLKNEEQVKEIFENYDLGPAEYTSYNVHGHPDRIKFCFLNVSDIGFLLELIRKYKVN